MIDQNALLDAVRHRVPFRIAQRLLSSSGYPKGRSWADILEKLEDLDVSSLARPTLLQQLFIEALIVSEKIGSIYPVGEEGLKALHKFAISLENSLPPHEFIDKFPFIVSESVLAATPQHTAVPTRVMEVDGATVVIFCTSRIIERREEIDVSTLSPRYISLYESAIGIKRTLVQSFNALIIPYDGKNAIILSQNDKNVNTPSAVLDIFTIRNSINSAIGSIVLSNPINLYPAIKPLYQSEEGEVTLLSHTVANGVKTERMRAGKCVRQERFHRGGMDAVAENSNPYQISIHWRLHGDDEGHEARPELTLDGSYQLTYQVGASLTEFGLQKCGNYSDAKFVLSKLLGHLPTAA